MKKYLLPPEGQFYKANLHCHSTVSDGRWSPERIKAEYMARGYSVIAYTDHDVLIPHQELTDEHFVALNGYELEVNQHASKVNPIHWSLYKPVRQIEPDVPAYPGL